MALSIVRNAPKGSAARVEHAEDVEVRLLLEGIYQYYGHDFRHYEPGLLRDAILRRVKSEGVGSISQYQHRLLRDRSVLEGLVGDLSAKPRDLFDPPGYWRYLRRKILPVLRTYPSSRLWVAGCSSGEDAYSLAILLHEEGLGSRAVVYATELDESMLNRAREGRISAAGLDAARARYRSAGGKASLQRYGVRSHGGLSLEGPIGAHLVFASHSLATDSSFNEFNVILCRNILGSFTSSLKARVKILLHQSLCLFGYLGLGAGESMDESPAAGLYENVSARHHLFRRLR